MTQCVETLYSKIESEIPTAKDLLTIPILESGEPMTCVDERDGLFTSFHNSPDTVELVGRRMMVRGRVRGMLMDARDELSGIRSSLRLKLFYAYRALIVQQNSYQSALAKARQKFPDKPEAWQLQFAHTLTAMPEVAGHPTGGAVDVTLFDLQSGQDLDMGVPVVRTAYRDAGRKIYTDSPEISGAAIENRHLLRDVMASVGFSPFAGEFWHFSFGDREWSFKQGHPAARYGQLSVEEVLVQLGAPSK